MGFILLIGSLLEPLLALAVALFLQRLVASKAARLALACAAALVGIVALQWLAIGWATAVAPPPDSVGMRALLLINEASWVAMIVRLVFFAALILALRELITVGNRESQPRAEQA